MRKYYQDYYFAIKQILQQEILQKTRQLIQKHYYKYPEFERLLEPLPEWKNREFQVLASLVGIHSSACKRLFDRPGYTGQKKFSKKNSQAFAYYLEYEKWEDLEKSLSLKTRNLKYKYT